MKRLEILVVIKVICTLICLINFNTEDINAQDIGIFNARPVSKPAGGNRTGRVRLPAKPTPVLTNYKIEYRTKTEFVKATGLSVTISPYNADITLKPANGVERKYQADANGVLILDKLKAGKYKLVTSAEDYIPQESEISILPQKFATIPITLKKITYDFSIETNVDEGEARYAPVKVLGTNPDGTLRVQEIGGYCVVLIKDKKTIIDDLSKGNYYVKVSSPKAPEYLEETKFVKIPEDIPETGEANKNAFFSIDLDYKLSTKTFQQIYTSDAWELPQNWKIDSKGLKGNGVGVALPKEKDFRYYKDFQLESTVRLMNNTSIGFVLRAVDDKNYYLIKLTGGASTYEPYHVSAFIVKDGAERLVMDNVIPDKNTISNEKHFSVIIQARGDTFKIFLEDSETGYRYPLGNAVFDSKNFPIGAVGIGVTEKSSFEVGRFSVCYETCVWVS